MYDFLEPGCEKYRKCTRASGHSNPSRRATRPSNAHMLRSSPARFLLKIGFLQLENRMVRIWLKVGPVEEVFRPLPGTAGTVDRRSCNIVPHTLQATRAAADLERFASFRRAPPAAGSPRPAGPSSQALWFEAWNLAVSSLELVKLEPGACQVEPWALSSSRLGFGKWRLGTCQVRAWKLST